MALTTKVEQQGMVGQFQYNAPTQNQMGSLDQQPGKQSAMFQYIQAPQQFQQQSYVAQQSAEQGFAQQPEYAPQQSFVNVQAPVQATAMDPWEDFNRRRNATIRTTGFTTKKSAKMPSAMQTATQQPTVLMMQGQPTLGGAAISQDAAAAYLQSIGVASAPAPQPQQEYYAGQYAPQMPMQPLEMPNQYGYATYGQQSLPSAGTIPSLPPGGAISMPKGFAPKI